MDRSVYLKFNAELMDKPIISTLIKKHDVEVNILEAHITPNEEGSMFVKIAGSAENIDKSLGYLVSTGVEVTVKPKRLIWKEDVCTSCGACISQCPSKALSLDPKTQEVTYDQEKCIYCFLCIPACPYNALEKAIKES